MVVDHNVRDPDCGGLSVVDIDEGSVVYRSPRGYTVFDLSLSADLRQAIGSPGFGNGTYYSRWVREDETWTRWTVQAMGIRRPFDGSSTFTGLSIVDDDEMVLGLGRLRRRVGRFSIPTGTTDVELGPGLRIGNAHSLTPGRVFVTRDSSVAHLLGPYGVLSTVELGSLEEFVPPVRFDPTLPDERLEMALAVHGFTTTRQIAFGDISPDERYIVANRWAAPQLAVIDLQKRRAHTVDLGEGITMTGGIAFNHGYENPGLLAVNVLHSVIVYEFRGEKRPQGAWASKDCARSTDSRFRVAGCSAGKRRMEY